MRKAFLFVNTLRYLKWQQVYFRIKRLLIKPKVTEIYQESELQRPTQWAHLALYSEKIDDQLQASFLNHTKKLSLPTAWDSESPSKLWVYNLHYFEDLLSENAKTKSELHQQLLIRWIDENPVGYGNGWEPYPTSLRIVNIIKAWLGGLDLDKKVLRSVFEQASFLSNDLERHLLGNHYFVNLKALLFAGVVFENVRWSNIAVKGLIVEIPEQILEDGGNFELSPMYHSLMLVDMLDLLNLSRAYPDDALDELVRLLEVYIPRMLSFMDAMAHVDGGVSFFNDSVDGVAPPKDKIKSYAEQLGFEMGILDSSDETAVRVIDNHASGYICAATGSGKVIFDAASVGPDYIPAHAHADTLSFELSIGSQRVFVNSGVFEYSLGRHRCNQRKTAAHNTVEVDGRNSSEVWSGFRVARRARVVHRSFELSSDYESVVFRGAHNGYKSLAGGCIHMRDLEFSGQMLSVTDSLIGSYKYAVARFHIHPNLEVEFVGGFLRIEGDSFTITSDLNGSSAKVVDSSFSPSFGVAKSNKVLEVDVDQGYSEVKFIWNLKKCDC